MLDLPFTANAIFSRIVKNSKIEGEGGRHIPKRILSSLQVNCSLNLLASYLSQIFKGMSYAICEILRFIRNTLFSTGIFPGQVNITLDVQGIKKILIL